MTTPNGDAKAIERCEMCGDQMPGEKAMRLHDTYDCAVSLAEQRAELRSELEEVRLKLEQARYDLLDISEHSRSDWTSRTEAGGKAMLKVSALLDTLTTERARAEEARRQLALARAGYRGAEEAIAEARSELAAASARAARLEEAIRRVGEQQQAWIQGLADTSALSDAVGAAVATLSAAPQASTSQGSAETSLIRYGLVSSDVAPVVENTGHISHASTEQVDYNRLDYPVPNCTTCNGPCVIPELIAALRRRDHGNAWDFDSWRQFVTWLANELEGK